MAALSATIREREQGDGRRPPPATGCGWPSRSAPSPSTTRRSIPGAGQCSTRPGGWARTTAASASATRRTSPTVHGAAPNLTMNRLVASCASPGSIGNVGVFVPQDPGRPRRAGAAGQTSAGQNLPAPLAESHLERRLRTRPRGTTRPPHPDRPGPSATRRRPFDEHALEVGSPVRRIGARRGTVVVVVEPPPQPQGRVVEVQ